MVACSARIERYCSLAIKKISTHISTIRAHSILRISIHGISGDAGVKADMAINKTHGLRRKVLEFTLYHQRGAYRNNKRRSRSFLIHLPVYLNITGVPQI